MKRMMKRGANAILGSFGYEVRRKRVDDPIDPQAEGFPAYASEANKLGMDVNDWEEKKLGWAKGLPILEQTVFPYLREDSIVCNLGVGTGRWARHIAAKLTSGELHLVDHSPWIVNFVQEYFRSNPRVRVHLNDGNSLPWHGAWIDLLFSAGTFIALKLGHFYLYSREFFRVLKPGGYCILEYIDVTRPEGWNWLETQSNRVYGDCYTYYAPEVVERVFSSAGFEKVKSYQIGRSSYLIVRKPETNEEA